MKKITLLIFFFVANNLFSQIVSIPDLNFKAILLAANAETNYNIAKDLAGNPATIDTNGDNEIQVSEALQISSLSTAYGVEFGIQSFQGIEFFTNLTFFQSLQSQISTIDLTNNINLTTLDLRSNSLNVLNLETNVNLKFLYLYDTQISTLLYSNLSELEEFDITNSPLNSFDFSNLPSLRKVNCFGTDLSNLDFGNNPFFGSLTCGSPSLTYVNIKNGWLSTSQSIQIYNSPNLTYLCGDNSEITQLAINFAVLLPNCNVGSYCSFNPGGTFYALNGANKLDSNLNGCDSNDGSIANLQFDIFSNSSGSFYANSSGSFSIPFQAGNYSVLPKLENPSYFNISPSQVNIQFPDETSPYNQDFCVTPNGIHYDLEVVFTRLDAQIPGADVRYVMIYKNKGNQVQSGTITLNFDDAIMDFVSSNPAEATLSTNQLTWNYSNLNPFETREIEFILNLNSPMETPALNNGDRIEFNGTIQPENNSIVDDFPLDNTIDVNFEVVNSADPNDITCLEGNSVGTNQIGKYVHYMIRFENIGTANAMNVVVKNMIDASKFDVTTLIPLSSNYEFITRKNGNEFEFIFENINLPFDDQNNDGYLVYKIKLKNNLVVGNTFTNQANIYFDFNFPIETNTVSTAIETLSFHDFSSDNLTVSPNPTSGNVNLNGIDDLQFSVEIYDLTGKRMVKEKQKSQIDFGAFQNGIYFIKIINNQTNTSIIKKIIKY